LNIKEKFKDDEASFHHTCERNPAMKQESTVPDLATSMDQLSMRLEKTPESQAFSITARLDSSLSMVDADMPAKWADKGLKMIQWHCPEPLSKVPSRLLWQVAKAGIWNHVADPNLSEKGPETPLSRFILDNPHVVHSFGLFDDRTAGSAQNAYDTITTLPGRPFWQTLSGPSAILSYLTRHPAAHLARLRWDNGTLVTLGENMVYHFMPPPDLPRGYLDRVCAMVAAGGSVDPAYVRSNLEKAYLIGYARENGVLVGNSCLKHPRKSMIERLKKTTDLDLNGCVERGYTSVRPEYRSLGVGRKLLEGLTARAGKYKVFSIIDEDNLATRKIALHNNTRKIATYFSEKTNKHMGIWMPARMMPGPEKETK
jgi:GNAT superfamily N-acetyltransferase